MDIWTIVLFFVFLPVIQTFFSFLTMLVFLAFSWIGELFNSKKDTDQSNYRYNHIVNSVVKEKCYFLLLDLTERKFNRNKKQIISMTNYFVEEVQNKLKDEHCELTYSAALSLTLDLMERLSYITKKERKKYIC